MRDAGKEKKMTWAPSEFLVASRWCAPHKVSGYIYRGLGLSRVIKGSPKGRRPPTWTLTHLGSGHAICNIVGKVADAFPIATEIAECGDWDFDGLKGWVNVDPELPDKTRAVLGRHDPKKVFTGGGGGSEEAARAIAVARA